MILPALAYYCNLDTGEENYDLGEFPVLVRQNIERTPIKPKVEKLQATKLPSPWIR